MEVRDRRRWGVLLAALIVATELIGCGGEQDALPPPDPEAQRYLMEGTEALERNEFARALAYADSAERRVPDAPDALFLRGRTYADLGDLAAADSVYERVIARWPQYPGVWHNRGNSAYRRQQYSAAISYYRKELEANPAPLPWRGMGRSYLELGQVDSARFAFEQALAVDSSYAPAHFSLALLYEDEGNLEKALPHAEQAFELNPQNLDFRYLLGSYLLKLDRSDEAIEHLLAVAEARPWHHASHYNLGQALLRTGRREQGAAMLERSERLRALDAKVVQQMNSVQSNPTDPLAHAALGSALRRAGRNEEAMRAYKMSYHLDPENLDVQNNIANLHLVRHDTTEAIGWYHRILERDSAFVDVWVNLGVVYALAGEERSARRAWERALRYEPEHEAARAYLQRLD